MEQSIEEIEKFAQSAENSRIRAELWGDFVGWDNRRRGENGWLLNQLKNYSAKKVLDAALGDGVDTIYLLQQGFDVSANEIDDAFRSKAIENAKKAGFSLNPTSADWRDLSEAYRRNSQDALICMGNSLTCIKGEEGLLKALHEFQRILKPGGGLVD